MKRAAALLTALILFQFTNAQCLAPIGEYGTFAANPETDINGNFRFDYQIKCDIEVRANYTNDAGAVVPKTTRYNVDFYVNTTDGSAYFPSGFFMSNFGRTSNRQGSINGAIWKSDGQMVSYVLDAMYGQKRAIVVETGQTADNVFTGQLSFIGEFMAGIRDATSTPAPIPADLPWGATEGFVSEIAQPDGSMAKITIYFDLDPDIPPIKTSVPLVGFLTGVVKDFVFHNCNRLAVFSKMEMLDTGEYIQSELLSIEPKMTVFVASGYKKMTLGGSPGTGIANQMEDFKVRLMDLYDRKQRLEERKRRCGSAACRENAERQLELLQEDITRVECQMYTAMGVEDRMEECLH
ncbi:hypothetical protein [Spongiimicrobium sp. 3-5]|uniref:hypothetical protein n=1 Tax=Spongiimicrobium sp. 3-5 TaxID=3332596 RepID=UPI00397F820E